MNLTTRIPANNGHVWTAAQAASAVGKPLIDRIGEGARRIGTVREARVEGDGDLVLTIEVDNLAVNYNFATEAVSTVSLVPAPRVVDG